MARHRRAGVVVSGSRACRSSSSSCCCSSLHVHGAAGLPAAVHLHDLPLDAAAADPARGRPDLRHRGGRDRPLLPGDHRLLGLRLRRAVQGVRARLARRRRRRSRRACWSASSTACWSPSIGIPSFIATLGTQFFWAGMATVLSGGKSYALRGAEESSVWQCDRRPPVRRLRSSDLGRSSCRCRRSGRRRSSSSSGSSSTATGSASTCSSSAIPTRSRASSASTSSARRSSSSR